MSLSIRINDFKGLEEIENLNIFAKIYVDKNQNKNSVPRIQIPFQNSIEFPLQKVGSSLKIEIYDTKENNEHFLGNVEFTLNPEFMRANSVPKNLWITLFDDEDNLYDGDFKEDDIDCPKINIWMKYSLTLQELKDNPDLMRTKNIITSPSKFIGSSQDPARQESSQPFPSIQPTYSFPKIERISQSETNIEKVPDGSKLISPVKKESSRTVQSKEEKHFSAKKIKSPFKKTLIKNAKGKVSPENLSKFTSNLPVKESVKSDHSKIKISDLQSNQVIDSSNIAKGQINSQLQGYEENKEYPKLPVVNTFIVNILHQISSFELEKVKVHQDLLNQKLLSEHTQYEDKYNELLQKNTEIKDKIIEAEKEIEIKIKNVNTLKFDLNGMKELFNKIKEDHEADKSINDVKEVNSNIENLIEKCSKLDNEINSLNNLCENLINELVHINNELEESIKNFQKLEKQFENDAKINMIEDKNKLINEVQHLLNNNLLELERNNRLIKKAKKDNTHLQEELEDVKKDYSNFREDICKYNDKIKQSKVNFDESRIKLQTEINSYKAKLDELSKENEKMIDICESNPNNKLNKLVLTNNLQEPIKEIFNRLNNREKLVNHQSFPIEEFKYDDDEKLNEEDTILIEQNNLITTLEKEINISQIQYEGIQNKKRMIKELEDEILNYETIYSHYQNRNFEQDLNELINQRNQLEEELSKKKEMINLIEGKINSNTNNLQVITSDIENKEEELKTKEFDNQKLKDECLNKIQELDKYINDIKETKKQIEEIEAKTKDKTNYLKVAKASLKERRMKDNLVSNPDESDVKGKLSPNEGLYSAERNDQEEKLETNSIDQIFSKSSSSQGEPASNINILEKDKNEEDKTKFEGKNVQSNAYEYYPQGRDFAHEGKFTSPNLNDQVDRLFSDYMQKLNVPINLKKIHGGQYIFGTKKIMAKIQNDKLIIRIGGGYMMIDEFLSAYTAQELAKAQLDQKIEANKKVINQLIEKRNVNQKSETSLGSKSQSKKTLRSPIIGKQSQGPNFKT